MLKECYVSFLEGNWHLSDMHLGKITFLNTRYLGQYIRKVVKVNLRSSITTKFKSLVKLRVLLNYIGWHRIEHHGEPLLLSLMNFPLFDHGDYCKSVIFFTDFNLHL